MKTHQENKKTNGRPNVKAYFQRLMILMAAIMVSTVLVGCDEINGDDNLNNPNGTTTKEAGVMINGVKWATRNVDKPGTFTAKPENTGMYYQWNRKVGWSATDPMINSNGGTVWDESYPTGTTWEKANDPCPSGWRVPTLDEYKKLLDREKVSYGFSNEKDIIGLRCTDKASGKSIFLPAAGFRSITNGKLYYVGDEGNYWSSTQDVYVNYYAYIISFEMDGPYPVYWHDYFRSYGNCVRCVAD